MTSSALRLVQAGAPRCSTVLMSFGCARISAAKRGSIFPYVGGTGIEPLTRAPRMFKAVRGVLPWNTFDVLEALCWSLPQALLSSALASSHKLCVGKVGRRLILRAHPRRKIRRTNFPTSWYRQRPRYPARSLRPAMHLTRKRFFLSPTCGPALMSRVDSEHR